jgi:hypothetical protein
MRHLTTILDKVANDLQARGLLRLAYELDTVANSLGSVKAQLAAGRRIIQEDGHW